MAAALLRICRHIGALQSPERVRAWMQRIVRNEARRIRRRRTADTCASLGEIVGPAHETPSLLRLDVVRALRQLPRDEARALALFYLAGLSTPEVAARIGRPEGTIRRWLHQGRRHLVTQMEAYAPMKSEPAATPAPKPTAAAILSTDLPAPHLQELVDALKAAFWPDVATFGDIPLIAPIAETGVTEFRLTEPLRGRYYIVLDEKVGNRSAFEILPLLNATVEAQQMMFCLLATSPDEQTLWAAWIAGFDLCIAKPVNLEEFRRRSRHAWLGVKNLLWDPGEWEPRLEKHRKAFVFGPLGVLLTDQVFHVAPFGQDQEARRRGHDRVETEHLLLALLAEENNSTRLLARLGVSPDTVRSVVEARLPPGNPAAPAPSPATAGCSLPASRPLPLAPSVPAVPKLASEEAKRAGERIAGTEYLLLGLLRLKEGLAGEVLRSLGLDLEQVRREIADPAFQALRHETYGSVSQHHPAQAGQS